MEAFEVEVSSVEEGVKIMDTLANYDKSQYENRIKPDYCNSGGIVQWCDDCDGNGTPGWEDWYDEESGEDDPGIFLSMSKERI